MDLDRLVCDIKLALEYTSNLKSENDSLHNKIDTLEGHISMLESLLKEKEASCNELLEQKHTHENTVLDKIVALQMDQKLKEDHKKLLNDFSELRDLVEKTIASHNMTLAEKEEESGRRMDAVRTQYEDTMRVLREEHDAKIKEMQGVIDSLGFQVQEGHKLRVEETTKLHKEYEEKLSSFKKAASYSTTAEMFKRKLTAQKQEHVREVEGLKQQILQLQGPRGRKY